MISKPKTIAKITLSKMKTTHFPNQARTGWKAVPGMLGNWQLEPHKALSLLDLSRDLADSQRPALSLSSAQIE